MNILFKQVKISNFLSIGEAEIKLDNNGYVLVEGVNNCSKDNAKSNGAGKSSLYEAILWAITGSTSRGIKDVCNINGNDGALIDCEFEIDNKTYRVIRAKNHSQYKTDLKIFIDNVDVSGKGIRASEQIFKERLPELTMELLSSVVLLGQGLPYRFSSNTPSKRKEILEQLSKSDFMIEDLKKRISERKAIIDKESNDKEYEIKKINLTIDINNKSIIDNKNKLEELESKAKEMLSVNIKEYEAKKEEVLAQIDVVQKELDNYNSLKEEKQNALLKEGEKLALISKSDKVVNGEKKLETERSSCYSIKAKADAIKAQIDKINSLGDVCPTCGHKIENKVNVSDLIEDYNALIKDFELHKQLGITIKNDIDNYKREEEEIINNNKREINKEISQINDKISSLSSLIRENNSKLNDITNILSKHEQENGKLEALKDEIISNIVKCEEDIKSMQEDLVSKETELDVIKSRKEVITKFETITKRDFRGYLLSNVINYIDKRAKNYCKNIFGTNDIKFELDGNDIDILYCNKQYEALSGGERQKIDIIVQLSIRDMLCNFMNFSSNIIVFDEVFDFLDSNGAKAVIDVITQINDISSIYVITHHSDIDILYDKIITVTKGEDGVSEISESI